MSLSSKTPRLIFIIMLVMMTLPLVFAFVPNSRGKVLFGIQSASKERINIWRMLDHTGQDRMEKAAKQTLGFCNHGVRLNNELNYRLFHYSPAPKLIIGQKDFFYEDIYVNEYTGKDFVSEKTVIDNVRAFKALQDSLHEKGIELLLVLEPGKVRFMPEYLPKQCRKGLQTNYDSYSRELRKQGVRHLDLNQYFRNVKSTASHPLYSKHGIHWSTYGMWTAADTLQKFIEEQCGIVLNGFNHIGDSISNRNKDLDFDMEPPMNLMHELRHEDLGFPIIQFVPQPQSEKPQALIIADSYAWSLWDNGILQHWFDRPLFWYYNSTVYPEIWEPTARKADKSQIPNILIEKRVILLMVTDANLRDFGWNAIEEIRGTALE